MPRDQSARRISRRRFLIALAGVSALAVSAPLVLRRLANRMHLEFRAAETSSAVSPHDMRSMIALGEVLIARDLWTGTDRIADMIRNAIEERGVAHEYRNAADLLDRATSERFGPGTFAELPIDARREVVATLAPKFHGGRMSELSLYTSKARNLFEFLSRSKDEWRFRELVVRDSIRRFYGSDIAWTLAGYTNYPGVPGDPRGYTRPGGPG